MDRNHHLIAQTTTLAPATGRAVTESVAVPAAVPAMTIPDPQAMASMAGVSVSDHSRGKPLIAAWLVFANLGLTVVCAAVIGAFLALSFGPRFFAYETFIVRSGSMEPAIRTGSIVVVEPVSPTSIKVGDVITYRRPEDPDNTITHRVVGVRAPAGLASAPVFRTKGDANNAPDPWEVQLQGIAWRQLFSVPLAGYLFTFIQQPAGRLLFLVLPGGGLGLLWLHRSWLQLRGAQPAKPSHQDSGAVRPTSDASRVRW
jgi:signal peptidase I